MEVITITLSNKAKVFTLIYAVLLPDLPLDDFLGALPVYVFSQILVCAVKLKSRQE